MIVEQENPQGNLINIAVQTLIVEELIYKVDDVLRVSILKLFVLFTEHGDSYFPQPKQSQVQVLARFCLVACAFLQKKERDHIQIDVGTVFQSQNLLAQVSTRYTIPPKFFPTILRSLFYAGGIVEPRGSNKSAIDILLPNVLARTDGALLCCRYLRRCVTDDMQNLPNNSIIFQAIVRDLCFIIGFPRVLKSNLRLGLFCVYLLKFASINIVINFLKNMEIGVFKFVNML